jgi:hypothetical protein
MFPENRFRLLVAAGCLAAMLSGCGGGSSSTMPDDDMMPGGDPMTRMPGGGTAGPIGFTAGVDRLYASGRTEGITDDGMTTITETSDGLNVTVDGKSVEFGSSDLGAGSLLPSDWYYKEYGTNETVGLWSEEEGGFEGTPAPEFDYLNVYGFSHNVYITGADITTSFEASDFTRGDLIYVVHGKPTDGMPVSGTATYDGRVEAREWRDDAATLAYYSTEYKGDFDMTATFGASGAEVTGTFSFPSVPGGIIPFSTSSNGNQLSISGESIDTGPFAGYENIGIRAAFFGPAAAEVGGVFEGDNPTAGTLMHGYFAGEKQ